MYEISIDDHSIKFIFPNFELKLIFESDKMISQSLIKKRLGLIMILYIKKVSQSTEHASYLLKLFS